MLASTSNLGADRFDPEQNHPDAETRTAAVWCIINLCHTDRTSFHARARRPREILDKLKAMGVDEELRRLREDEALDVRERVRDALEQLGGF